MTNARTLVSSLHRTKIFTPRRILADGAMIVAEGEELYDDGTPFLAFWWKPEDPTRSNACGFPSSFGHPSWMLVEHEQAVCWRAGAAMLAVAKLAAPRP
jgi:hypothetical protein